MPKIWSILLRVWPVLKWARPVPFENRSVKVNSFEDRLIKRLHNYIENTVILYLMAKQEYIFNLKYKKGRQAWKLKNPI